MLGPSRGGVAVTTPQYSVAAEMPNGSNGYAARIERYGIPQICRLPVDFPLRSEYFGMFTANSEATLYLYFLSSC